MRESASVNPVGDLEVMGSAVTSDEEIGAGVGMGVECEGVDDDSNSGVIAVVEDGTENVAWVSVECGVPG